VTDHFLTFRTLAETWNFVFHSHDVPVTLAIFRVLFGMLLAIESIGLTTHGADLFSTAGLALPQQTFSYRGANLFTLFHGSRRWMRFIFTVHFVSCLLLTVGLFTRIAAFLIFLNFASRSKQNWYVIQGGDNVAKFMSLLLVFSNAGALYSLDAWFGFSWMSGSALPASQWPQRLMEIQVSVLYLRSCLLKLRVPNWIDGTAVFYALYGNPHYRWRTLPSWLFSGPVIAFFTWGTLVSEGAAGTLMWVRETKYYAMAAIAAVHIGIEIFLRLKYFQYLMIICLVLFVTSDAWLSIIHVFRR
jgi:hypothetical protein